MSETNKKLSPKTLKKSFRTWFFFNGCSQQAESMLGMAFGHSMAPVIDELYDTKEEKAEALKRHTTLFNTEAQVGSICNGIVCGLEEAKANGQCTSEAVSYTHLKHDPALLPSSALRWPGSKAAPVYSSYPPAHYTTDGASHFLPDKSYRGSLFSYSAFPFLNILHFLFLLLSILMAGRQKYNLFPLPPFLFYPRKRFRQAYHS